MRCAMFDNDDNFDSSIFNVNKELNNDDTWNKIRKKQAEINKQNEIKQIDAENSLDYLFDDED